MAANPRTRTALLILALFLSGIAVSAQGDEYIRRHYSKQEFLVPMRDGVRLFTEVYIPEDNSRAHPILLKRTPYGLHTYGPERYKATLGPSHWFAEQNYIFVYQDIRGKFRSEGLFEHHRTYNPNKSGPGDVDEASDAYDTIEWLVNNIPGHNGRVGMWGISYPGWLGVMALIEPHPALAAVSPQGSPGDQWAGDDYYHNGAFRLMYAFQWSWKYARVRSGPTENGHEGYPYGTNDGYRFFLDLGPIANVNERCFHGRIPMWNQLIEHWSYDEYWQAKSVFKDLKGVRIPVLNVAGWFDAEDFFGPLGIYEAIERTTARNRNTLVVGPWSHGGWAYGSGFRLGELEFDSTTALEFRREMELPFFNHHLKDEQDPRLPEALVFETGANRWRAFESWPPAEVERTGLYLRGGKRLGFDPPRENTVHAADCFVSDPADPVPYTQEARTTQGHLWMVEDQRFLSSRDDVLSYQSDRLSRAIGIAGPVSAELYVTTTGSDADWVVKLIDVHPDGSQFLLAAEVIRAKFRGSFTHPQPLEPGEVTAIRFDLPDRLHTFLPGHRIMVQIQSSWFPLIDRNPHVFLAIPEAGAGDFRRASHTVHRSSAHPSRILLPILDSDRP